MEITPFHVKQVNQTQQQNEGKNKLASSESNNAFGHLFASYLSKGPNTELGTLSKENAAKIEPIGEEQNGPVKKIPLPTDLIQTVEPHSPNLEEEQGFLNDEEVNQPGLAFLNLVPNQLVNPNLAINHVEGSNTSSEKIDLVSQEVLLDLKKGNVTLPIDPKPLVEEISIKYSSNQAVSQKTNAIDSSQILTGVIQNQTIQELDTNLFNQQVSEINTNQTVTQNPITIQNNEILDQVPTGIRTEQDLLAQSQSPSHTLPNSSQETMQPEDQKQTIQESTPLVRKDFPLFGNDVEGTALKDNPTEQIQNLTYTTISRTLNQKDIFNDSPKHEIPIEENKMLLLDKSQIIGHQPLPLQVNNSSKMSNMQSTPPSIHINDFVPELQKWMSNIKIINDQPGASEAKVSLFPKNLGHIEIKIMTVEGQLSAEIMTETLLAKDALEGQLPQLKQSLQQSGLVVQKIEIFQQPVNQLNDLNQATLSFSHSGTSSSNEQRSNNTKQASSNKGKKIELTELGDEIPSYGHTRRNSVSNIDFTA